MRDLRSTLIAVGRHPDLDHRDLHDHAATWASRSTTSRCSAWCSPSASSSTTRSSSSRTSSATSRRRARIRYAAASTGTREIALAVMATTLSLVVIFLPVAFMGGHHRALLPQLRRHRRVRDRGLAAGLVHADADAVLALPAAEGAGTRRQGGPLLPRDRPRLRRVPALVAAAPLGDRAARRSAIVAHDRAADAAPSARTSCPQDDQSEFEVIVQTPGGYTLERTDAVLQELEAKLRELPRRHARR